MSTVTTWLNLVKAAVIEQFSLATLNNNLDKIDVGVKNANNAKNVRFSMIAARGNTPGAGVNFGHVQFGTAPNEVLNNDFCVIDNEGVAGQASEKGRVRITKAGIYNLSANFTCTQNPGNLNFCLVVDQVGGGSRKITMNRSGTYGDWEANVSETGVLLKVGDFVTGYMAASNGIAWAIGSNLTYVGELGTNG